MSKNDPPSKYLSLFYNTSGRSGTSGSSDATKVSHSVGNAHKNVQIRNTASASNQGGNNMENRTFPGSHQKSANDPLTSVSSKHFPSSRVNTINESNAYDADKFRKPGDFFKSSQSPSQFLSSQNKTNFAKRTSFGAGGSTHEMLSQSFVLKKPQAVTGGRVGTSVSFKTPAFSPNNSTGQRRSHVTMDKDVASTEALALQWTAKIMRQKKDGQTLVNLDKRNPLANNGKSPLGKSFWADSSFSKQEKTCKNQQNDPWYSSDVWGDDFPEEAVDACLLLATQEAERIDVSSNPLSSWMDETWASPAKPERPAQQKPSTSAKISLFSETTTTSKSENFKDLLSRDDDFLALIDNVEAQPKPVQSKMKAELESGSSKKIFSSQAPQHNSLSSWSQVRKTVPLSECMPVGSGNKSTFVIKAKEFESPSKQETITQSQRTLRKPVKSLPSPSSSKMACTTEWLRGRLEKISSEYSTLKEDVQVKEGESKLLREKLKTAEEEVKKQKLDKAQELERVREVYETKLKQLKKELEATKTQAMFKAKEAESSLEKYRELKSVSVMSPEPSKCATFRNIPSLGARPGESMKVGCRVDDTMTGDIGVKPHEQFELSTRIDETILDVTTSADIINETIDGCETSKKEVMQPSFDVTPKISALEDSLVNCVVKMSEFQSYTAPDSVHCNYSIPSASIFERDFVSEFETFKKASDLVVLGNQPKKELNHFLMPPMEYLPHALLQTEFNEQEVENYLVRRPTLAELWNVPYGAFGDAVLDDYEKTAVGESVPPDPAKIILSKSRYFSTMDSVHVFLSSLSSSTKWGSSERAMAKIVVDLATTMAKELYATLGDPRLLRTTYTIYDRDPKILGEFLDSTELLNLFDPLSPDRWKNESFVELRRCLVMIGYLCSVDHLTTRYIVNPKAYKSVGCTELYPTNEELSQCSKGSVDNKFSLKIMLKDGERKPGELKLMQIYRDLHFKKLTLIADLANVFNNDNARPPAIPESFSFVVSKNDSDGKPIENHLVEALKTALENSENVELRFGELSSGKCLSSLPLYKEFKNCLSSFGMSFRENNMRDLMKTIKGELNPQKILALKTVTSKSDSSQTHSAATSYRISIPDRLFEAVESDVLKMSDYGIIGAPVNRCLTSLEKEMLQLTLLNTKSLKNIVECDIDRSNPSDLDVTQYVSTCTDAEFEFSRKRKMSVEEMRPSKSMKVAEYETPPFDKNLYSHIQVERNDVNVINETQVPLLVEDDQLAKFEKREEIAELKRKMLAEERKMETKLSRHSLAPIKLSAQTSPTAEDSANREVAMEIEKMFQSQIRPTVQMDESVWSSETDNEGSELTTLSAHDTNVEIEFIPNLVKHFHHKLNNAGLLELLSEVFKEGGVLRFTHRLNGVMLGTVLMLQKIVMFQRKEIESCQNKLATIIREILYTRPSPRIVLEVNILLRYSVTLPSFTKMLCHNASPETFVTTNDMVYFTRGACMLEVICILVTYATEEDTSFPVYLEMTHWVYYIVCTEKNHMGSLYKHHNADRRRCMCITALNNTMVMIFHRTLGLYRKLVGVNAKTELIRQLEKIVTSGLQVFRLMYSYGSTSFMSSIRSQHLEYRQLLNWLQEMHDSTVYQGFRLSSADLSIVTELMKGTKDPIATEERYFEPNLQPDLVQRLPATKTWLFDSENSDFLVKWDSEESDEEA